MPKRKDKIPDWKKYENEVGKLLELQGYEVNFDELVNSAQTDVIAELKRGSILFNILVECKFHKNPNKKVGIDEVENFSARVLLARMDGLADKGLLVTNTGFTAITKSAVNYSKAKNFVELKTDTQILYELIDFDTYLEGLIEDFENDELSKYYIDLNAEKKAAREDLRLSGKSLPEKAFQTKEHKIFSPIDGYINSWLKKETPLNRIAILGEYGSGKTSFCRHYAYKLARKYRESKEDRVRIPILFNLGRFTKNIDFEDLIVGYLDRRCGVPNPKFNIFKKMNDDGLFLLIFDGFDEMAMQVDFDTIKGNLKEIEKLSKSPKSKVLLTSRPEYFISKKEEEEIFAPTSLLEKGGRFDRLNLIPLNESQISSFLQRRIPLIEEAKKKWTYYLEKIGEIHDLSDLSKRPVMLDMITKTLPLLIKAKRKVNAANLYQTYLEGEINRQAIDKKRKLLIKSEHRFLLMQTLAMHFYKENLKGIAAKKVRELIKDKFTSRQQEELEGHLRDFLTCSFLIREKDNYRFSHRSLVEYLTAKGFYEEIGEDKPDLFKINSLTKEIRDFLLELLELQELQPDKEVLWKWIKSTKNKSFDDVGYLGSNAIILLNLLGEELKGKDFSSTILHNAYLHSADLTRTNFKGAILKNANLNNTILKGADFSYADLKGASFGEMGEIWCVAFSPDGKYLASGGDDKTLKIWDVGELKEIATLKGHTRRVRGVAFSPDGKYLASGSFDCTIKIWDVQGLKEITTLKGHIGSVSGVAFSSDGKYLASGGLDCTVKIWDVQGLKEITALKGHTDVVWSVAFSPDSKYLASGGEDETIKIWDVQGLKEFATFRGHTDSVLGVAFSPDGKYLASGSDDKTVKLWDVRELKEIAALKRHTDLVGGVAFSPDRKYLASASDDKTIKIWDVAELKEIATLRGHTDLVLGVAFSPDGKYLASASHDKTIKIWSTDPESPHFGKYLRTIKGQINCEGMKIKGAKGLDKEKIEFLKERGAVDS